MLLDKLNQFNKKQQRLILFLGLMGSIVCQILFSPINNKMVAHGYNIIDFEFAWTANTMDLILTAWQSIIPDIIIFMIIDMFYPILYGMILVSWVLLADYSEKLNNKLLLIAILAPVFDYAENIFSFIVLLYPSSYLVFIPFMISIFALIKFIAIVIVLIANILKIIF